MNHQTWNLTGVRVSGSLPGCRCSSSSCTCCTAAGQWWCRQSWPFDAPWWPPGSGCSSAASARHWPSPAGEEWVWENERERERQSDCCKVPGFVPLDLSRHGGDAAQLNGPCQHVLAEAWILWVLQVADATADSVLIFHVSDLQFLIDTWGTWVKGCLTKPSRDGLVVYLSVYFRDILMRWDNNIYYYY